MLPGMAAKASCRQAPSSSRFPGPGRNVQLGAEDPAVAERTQAAFGVTRETLQEVLQRGRRDGELRGDLDAAATAESLFTLVLGLRVRARAGHGPAELTSVIDTRIRALRG
jgi:TetR/AcrR family transcriptional regulator, transcriptional repressor for nem operon